MKSSQDLYLPHFIYCIYVDTRTYIHNATTMEKFRIKKFRSGIRGVCVSIWLGVGLGTHLTCMCLCILLICGFFIFMIIDGLYLGSEIHLSGTPQRRKPDYWERWINKACYWSAVCQCCGVLPHLGVVVALGQGENAMLFCGKICLLVFSSFCAVVHKISSLVVPTIGDYRREYFT